MTGDGRPCSSTFRQHAGELRLDQLGVAVADRRQAGARDADVFAVDPSDDQSLLFGRTGQFPAAGVEYAGSAPEAERPARPAMIGHDNRQAKRHRGVAKIEIPSRRVVETLDSVE